MLASQTFTRPSKGEVVARKRSGRKHRLGHVSYIEQMNIVRQYCRRAAEMVFIHLPLVSVYVIGEYGGPAPKLQPQSHESNSREIFSDG